MGASSTASSPTRPDSEEDVKHHDEGLSPPPSPPTAPTTTDTSAPLRVPIPARGSRGPQPSTSAKSLAIRQWAIERGLTRSGDSGCDDGNTVRRSRDDNVIQSRVVQLDATHDGAACNAATEVRSSTKPVAVDGTPVIVHDTSAAVGETVPVEGMCLSTASEAVDHVERGGGSAPFGFASMLKKPAGSPTSGAPATSSSGLAGLAALSTQKESAGCCARTRLKYATAQMTLAGPGEGERNKVSLAAVVKAKFAQLLSQSVSRFS